MAFQYRSTGFGPRSDERETVPGTHTTFNGSPAVYMNEFSGFRYLEPENLLLKELLDGAFYVYQVEQDYIELDRPFCTKEGYELMVRFNRDIQDFEAVLLNPDVPIDAELRKKLVIDGEG